MAPKVASPHHHDDKHMDGSGKHRLHGVPKPTKPIQLPSNAARPSNPARPPVSDERSRIVPGPRMMRRGSTGYPHRTKARRQSGNAVSDIHEPNDFLKLNDGSLEHSDSVRLLKQHQEEDPNKEVVEEAHVPVVAKDEVNNSHLQRVYRRKPRRMSGCAAPSDIENIKRNMPCLLQRENSVHLIQKRIPSSRRASLTF